MTNNLRTLLGQTIAAQTTAISDVGLLLSGGLDSLTVGIACRDIGKRVFAYTFELDGYPSADRPKAELLAKHFGWPLRIVKVPVQRLGDSFLRLAVEHRCSKKVHFEVTYPMSFVLPLVEQHVILSGWNADDHYGNTAKVLIKFAHMKRSGATQAELKREFDEHRKAVYRQSDSNKWGDTFWFAERIALAHGKCLVDPYADQTIRTYFAEFNHEELCHRTKPLIRAAFADRISDLAQGAIATGVKLQKGGQVHVLFEHLLDDPRINRFAKQYTTVSSLCMRWAKEVRANPQAYEAEVRALPAAPLATAWSTSGDCVARTSMSTVTAASERQLFTVISLFAGGGGSSTGYRLAGGKVIAISEFIPEAARTYARNYPDTYIDQRDIRTLLQDPCQIQKLLGTTALDIVDGSPPCSEFSPAGKGSVDPSLMKSYSDGKQRDISCLPFDFARFVLLTRPKTAVMENVPALATRGIEILNGIRQLLSHEYLLSGQVLDASDFGVPQKRRRFFLIAVRRDVAEPVGLTDDSSIAALFPTGNGRIATLRAAFRELPQSIQDLYPWITSARTSALGAAIARLPRSPSRLTRPQHIDPTDTKNFTLTRCSWDLPAPTLTVTGQQPSGLAGAVHPEEDRKFTLPELKRLFALPDDFVLTGTVAQAAERICRMVPPPLTEAIAKSLYERVLKPYAEAKS